MSEMTLPSRYKIRNSNPGSLRPSTLPVCHGDSPQFKSELGRNISVFLKPPTPGNEPRTRVKGSGTTLVPPLTPLG